MGSLNVVFMGTPAVVIPVLDAVARGVGGLGGAVVAAYVAPDPPRRARPRRAAVAGPRVRGGAGH